MWRARNGFTLLSLIIALGSAAAAQPSVTPDHRPRKAIPTSSALPILSWRAEFLSKRACWTALDM